MHLSRTIHERYPYIAFATGTGWRVLECKAEGRTFISAEYDDKVDALVHVKSLNERYWLERRAGIDAQIAKRTAREQSAPPPSSNASSSLWTRLQAILNLR